jgi:hypothetical protein
MADTRKNAIGFCPFTMIMVVTPDNPAGMSLAAPCMGTSCRAWDEAVPGSHCVRLERRNAGLPRAPAERSSPATRLGVPTFRRMVRETVLLCAGGDGRASIDDVVALLVEQGCTDQEARDAVAAIVQAGEAIEPKEGRIRLI